jgi:hypothetical protein
LCVSSSQWIAHGFPFRAKMVGARQAAFWGLAVVVLGPGLAVLLERASGWRFRIVCGLGCLLVLWNLQLISQYRYGWIPAARADAGTLLANAVRLVGRKKFLLIWQVAVGPLLLWLILGRSGQGSAEPRQRRNEACLADLL